MGAKKPNALQWRQVLRHVRAASRKELAYGYPDSNRPVRPLACGDRNHRARPGEKGVTDSVGKEEAGPRAKVNPA